MSENIDKEAANVQHGESYSQSSASTGDHQNYYSKYLHDGVATRDAALHSNTTAHELAAKENYAQQALVRRPVGAKGDKTNQKFRAALGLDKESPICDEHNVGEHSQLFWPRMRVILREPMAEFWGTFFYMLFGNGSVAQVLLSNPKGRMFSAAEDGMGYGPYQSINWGYAIGVMLGIYVAGDSGAFLNPAITFAFCVYRGLPFRRWPIYLIAQFMGGFCACGVVYAVYAPAIDAFAGPGVRTHPPFDGATAQIFCTFPQEWLTNSQQFVSEFVTTTILMFSIFALKDDSNKGSAIGSKNFFPLIIFFLVFGIGCCFGFETSYAVNIARDTAPRLFAYAVGYGPNIWAANDYYVWVPVVASFTGCLFGGFLYDLTIYTGPESPVNTPWLGLPILLNPVKAYKKRKADRASGLLPNEEQVHPI